MFHEKKIHEKFTYFDNGFEWLGLPLKSILEEMFEVSRVSKVSFDSSVMACARFERWCRVKNIQKPSTEDVEKYFNELEAGGVRGTSIRCYKGQLRRVFAYLSKKGYYPNIMDDVDVKRAEYRERQCLTSDEVKTLMAADIPAREFAMISLMVFCGLRCVEVSEMLWGDIDGNQAVIRGKGRLEKNTSIFLPDTVLNALERWKNSCQSDTSANSAVFKVESFPISFGFPTCTPACISHTVGNVLKRVFPDKPTISAHCLRHTAITLALESGMDFFRVAKFARHSSPTMTMTYAHDNERFTDPAERRIESMLESRPAEATSTDDDTLSILKRALVKLIND